MLELQSTALQFGNVAFKVGVRAVKVGSFIDSSLFSRHIPVKEGRTVTKFDLQASYGSFVDRKCATRLF